MHSSRSSASSWDFDTIRPFFPNRAAENTLQNREYQPLDDEQIWQLHERALREVGAFVGHGSWDEDLKHIPEIYLQDRGAFYVTGFSDCSSKIIAMGALKKVSETTGEIKRMRVDPEFQGRGIGTKMLLLLEKRAIELGYKELILDTSILQTAAIHLYQKFFYQEYKRGILGGLETVFMRKNLLKIIE